jgi:hypothetical protein
VNTGMISRSEREEAAPANEVEQLSDVARRPETGHGANNAHLERERDDLLDPCGVTSRGPPGHLAYRADIIDPAGDAARQSYLGLILLILLPWIPRPAISPFWPKMKA